MMSLSRELPMFAHDISDLLAKAPRNCWLALNEKRLQSWHVARQCKKQLMKLRKMELKTLS